MTKKITDEYKTESIVDAIVNNRVPKEHIINLARQQVKHRFFTLMMALRRAGVHLPESPARTIFTTIKDHHEKDVTRPLMQRIEAQRKRVFVAQDYFSLYPSHILSSSQVHREAAHALRSTVGNAFAHRQSRVRPKPTIH